MANSSISFRSRITGLTTIREHTFWHRPLDGSSVVVDLGAHKGDFARRVHDLFGCRCYVVEANPDLAKSLVGDDSVTFLQGAIASESGTIEFHLADNPLANTAHDLDKSPFQKVSTIEVPGITFEELLAKLEIDHIDLLKIDIEGAELELFDSTSDETLHKISQIAVEFHDFCHFIEVEDVERITRRLEEMGFYPIRFMGNENTLFLNTDRVPLSPSRRFFIRSVLSPSRSLLRVASRLRSKAGGLSK